MQNLLRDLIKLLEQDDRLVSEGKLLKNKIVELALALDPGLIRLLLKQEAIRKHFSVEVEGVLVFDKIKNMLYVPYSEIDDVTYGVSDEEKQLNRQFFGLKEKLHDLISANHHSRDSRNLGSHIWKSPGKAAPVRLTGSW